MAYRSRQHVHGGGKFDSERQRRAMWANAKSAASKWSHNLSAAHDPSWPGMRRATVHGAGTSTRVRSAATKAGRGALKAPSRSRSRSRQRRVKPPSKNRGKKG